MRKTKQNLSYSSADPAQFFDTMDEEVLIEMVQNYPMQFKALCMLLTLDSQYYSEQEYRTSKNKNKKKL